MIILFPNDKFKKDFVFCSNISIINNEILIKKYNIRNKRFKSFVCYSSDLTANSFLESNPEHLILKNWNVYFPPSVVKIILSHFIVTINEKKIVLLIPEITIILLINIIFQLSLYFYIKYKDSIYFEIELERYQFIQTNTPKLQKKFDDVNEENVELKNELNSIFSIFAFLLTFNRKKLYENLIKVIVKEVQNNRYFNSLDSSKKEIIVYNFVKHFYRLVALNYLNKNRSFLVLIFKNSTAIYFLPFIYIFIIFITEFFNLQLFQSSIHFYFKIKKHSIFYYVINQLSFVIYAICGLILQMLILNEIEFLVSKLSLKSNFKKISETNYK